jgi:hypothetical protein
MNDKFGWGIWKTFNVMVLTAWGSGAFSVGIAAWVFRCKRLFPLMRMALLTSFLAYACGLLLAGRRCGPPVELLLDRFSVELEHALADGGGCHLHVDLRHRSPWRSKTFRRCWSGSGTSILACGLEWSESSAACTSFFPGSLPAYLLPGMHQSSLGALMLLAGQRVHPLWQTPWLPLLYLGAATFMSFGCVAGTSPCCVAWYGSGPWTWRFLTKPPASPRG